MIKYEKGIAVDKTTNLIIKNNRFEDCGTDGTDDISYSSVILQYIMQFIVINHIMLKYHQILLLVLLHQQ